MRNSAYTLQYRSAVRLMVTLTPPQGGRSKQALNRAFLLSTPATIGHFTALLHMIL